MTPLMYPASFFFHEPSTAYIFFIVVNLFVGITCILTSFLLEIFQFSDKVRNIVMKMIICLWLILRSRNMLQCLYITLYSTLYTMKCWTFYLFKYVKILKKLLLFINLCKLSTYYVIHCIFLLGFSSYT